MYKLLGQIFVLILVPADYPLYQHSVVSLLPPFHEAANSNLEDLDLG